MALPLAFATGKYKGQAKARGFKEKVKRLITGQDNGSFQLGQGSRHGGLRCLYIRL
jgi:hypothetical protein